MIMKKGFFVGTKRGKFFTQKNRRGQVWVETVLYTLIAFTLIGLVLAFVKPKIEEIQDRGVIEQSINVLNEIDLVIKNLGSPGNQRTIQLMMNRGILNIDGQGDKIFFELESRYAYSELGQNVTIGNLIAYTEKRGRINEVTLTRYYNETYNLTSQNKDELKRISRSSTPYKILITNNGEDSLNKTIINIEVIS